MPLTRLLQRLPALPTQCALCRGWARERVCGPCTRRFAAPVARCSGCALRVPEGVNRCGACLKAPPPFDAALAALDYAPPWDHLIGRFKFHGALDLAPALARQADASRHARAGARSSAP